MFDIARNNAIENGTTAKDWKQIKTKEHGGNMQFNNSTKSFNKENGNDKGKRTISLKEWNQSRRRQGRFWKKLRKEKASRRNIEGKKITRKRCTRKKWDYGRSWSWKHKKELLRLERQKMKMKKKIFRRKWAKWTKLDVQQGYGINNWNKLVEHKSVTQQCARKRSEFRKKYCTRRERTESNKCKRRIVSKGQALRREKRFEKRQKQTSRQSWRVKEEIKKRIQRGKRGRERRIGYKCRRRCFSRKRGKGGRLSSPSPVGCWRGC